MGTIIPSGKNVTLSSCTFNYNAATRFPSKAADGIDMEYFGSNGKNIENGTFNDCQFIFNGGHGLEVSTQSVNHVWHHRFNNCTFVANDRTYSVIPYAHDMQFSDCDFYGPIAQAYDNVQAQGVLTNDNTRFIRSSSSGFGCKFYEIYNNESINQDPVNDCPSLSGPNPNKHWLVDFSIVASQALFDNAYFESNRQMKLMNISGGAGTNQISITNCLFRNFGINSRDFGVATNANITTSNIQTVPGQQYFRLQTYYCTGAFNYSHPLTYITCFPKHFQQTYTNYVSDQYTCHGCTLLTNTFCPTDCSPCEKIIKNKTNELRISPNPCSEFLNIEGTTDSLSIKIFNLYGIEVFNSSFVPKIINTLGFASGVYFITLSNQTTFKLLKL